LEEDDDDEEDDEDDDVDEEEGDDDWADASGPKAHSATSALKRTTKRARRRVIPTTGRGG
jgi:hypothetical protein